MSEYLNDCNKIINSISSITKMPMLKPLVIELSDLIAKNLKERKPEAINQAKMVVGTGRYSKTPEALVNVSKIVKYLKDKHFPNISDRWISECMKPEYKETRTERGIDINDITNRDLTEYGAELKKRMRQLEKHGPAEEPKVKRSVEGLKNHDFLLNLSNAMVDIILNYESEYKEALENKDEKKIELLRQIDKEMTKRANTIKDKRFAVPQFKYEAIMLVSSTIDSLNNSTKGETQILSPWERYDREQKCRKCFGDIISCRSEKCTCACHETVKRLTTKGLKWAKEHNQDLAKLDEHIELLTQWEDNICAIGKVIIINPHTRELMPKKERKKILYNHIDKEKCDQCEFFLKENPNFFD